MGSPKTASPEASISLLLEERPIYHARTAHILRKQITKFSGVFSQGLPKTAQRYVTEKIGLRKIERLRQPFLRRIRPETLYQRENRVKSQKDAVCIWTFPYLRCELLAVYNPSLEVSGSPQKLDREFRRILACHILTGRYGRMALEETVRSGLQVQSGSGSDQREKSNHADCFGVQGPPQPDPPVAAASSGSPSGSLLQPPAEARERPG